ncbi:MAG: FHA domain-containing protein [Desulfobacterales bacterium]|jgi:pSer/pThr/pTyr-binding forkhead associated (FHA) protein
MPKISLRFKGSVLADYHLPAGCSLKIGRKTDNDVVIENLAVSGHHAKIDSVGDGFVFIDLKSKNGSFVNSELVTSHWLHDGDTINIGKHALTFSYFDGELRPEDAQSEMDKTMVMDTNEYRSMMEKSEPKSEGAAESAAAVSAETKRKRVRGYITFLSGGEGTLALKNRFTKIGKDASSDIVVKGWAVGKTAATISRTRDGYFFNYMDGFSKPRINNKKVSKKPLKLVDSDVLDIGSVKLQFIKKKPKKHTAQ